MTMRALLYARVCVDDGHNLAEQLEACREYAMQKGRDIMAELADTGPAGDGSQFSLPQRRQMLEMAQASQFDVLIVRDVTRISRSLAVLLSIQGSLTQQGIEIDCVQENGAK